MLLKKRHVLGKETVSPAIAGSLDIVTSAYGTYFKVDFKEDQSCLSCEVVFGWTSPVVLPWGPGRRSAVARGRLCSAGGVSRCGFPRLVQLLWHSDIKEGEHGGSFRVHSRDGVRAEAPERAGLPGRAG